MSEIITSIEAGRTRSWVDPIGAAELSSLVCRELGKKFQAIKARGGKVYFVTLTYDPAQWLPDGVAWASTTSDQRRQAGEACWDAMTTDRHVHNFIARLEAEAGLDLSARWWAKREFTKNGFLHHHMIIDGPEFLPYEQVYKCWGFGRVDCQVARTEAGLAWYVGKYCTKFGDAPPAWIYERPSGSLRFTTCSDGWWSSDLPQVRPARRAVAGVVRRSEAAEHRAEAEAYGFEVQVESIGDRIRRKADSVTVRCNGRREEVEGVTLEEFRHYRDPSTERSVIKARRSMDAISGLPLSQAVWELRLIAKHLEKYTPPMADAGGSGSDARPDFYRPAHRTNAPALYPQRVSLTRGDAVSASGCIAAATGKQLGLSSLYGASSSGVRQVERSDDLANTGSAAAERCVSDPQLYPAVHPPPVLSGPSSAFPLTATRRGHRSAASPTGSTTATRAGLHRHAEAKRSGARASRGDVARGSLILSSPQECNGSDAGLKPVEYVGVPPDPLSLS